MRFLAYICMLFSMMVVSMEFIDKEGVVCQIPAPLVVIFKESELGKSLKEDIDTNQSDRMVDFSRLGRACLKGEYINAVLGYAQDLESLTKKEVDPKEIYHLDTANNLGLQQQEVLFHLANRVWGYLKTGKQRHELKLSEHDEAYIRKVAKPYLNSPERLIRECQRAIFMFHQQDDKSSLNLSFSHLQKCYDQKYPFALSYGLPDILTNMMRDYLRDHPGRSFSEIAVDLCGHSIHEFIIDDWREKESSEKCDQLQKIDLRVNLANNGVTRISWSKLASNFTLESLNFSRNPITCIDDSVYDLMHKYRSNGKFFSVCIPHHQLTEAQLATIKYKTYLAVNTLVDRWFGKHNPDLISSVFGWGSVIATLLKSYYASGLLHTILWCPGGTIVGAGMAVMLGGKGIPFVAYKLAQITHSEIQRSDNVICLPGNIWVASNEKPLGTIWLDDSKKPCFIFKEKAE